MRNYASYKTVMQMNIEYRNTIREYERQCAYERNIVRSVPDRRIAVNSTNIDKDERWRPG